MSDLDKLSRHIYYTKKRLVNEIMRIVKPSMWVSGFAGGKNSAGLKINVFGEYKYHSIRGCGNN